MANTNAPAGLSPVRHLTGGQIRTNPYAIASGYNTAIGRGDPVELTGTGKNIAVAAAGNENNRGVFAGVEYTDSTGQRRFSGYWTANATGTNIVAHVWDDPMIVFEVQADSCAEGDVGAHCDWVAGTPSSTLERSTAYAAGSATATSGKSLTILGLVNKPGNAYGNYAKIEVAFREHDLLTGAAGAGGV